MPEACGSDNVVASKTAEMKNNDEEDQEQDVDESSVRKLIMKNKNNDDKDLEQNADKSLAKKLRKTKKPKEKNDDKKKTSADN